MTIADLHASRPSIYLDQWAWIDLARAEAGKPRRANDVEILETLRKAAAAGVAFPLSTTHYAETLRIKDPRQRRDLATVMATVSYFRTLRGGGQLMRHQMLNAMHESFGRPTFRPVAPEPLGLGVSFAFTGAQRLVPDLLNRVTYRHVTRGFSSEVLHTLAPHGRMLAQLFELLMIAGPPDEAIAGLRQYGYRPETAEAAAVSRLEWEKVYVGMLQDSPTSAAELRVRVMARELVHEHLELFNKLSDEYRLPLERTLGIDPDRPGSGRPKTTEFLDRVPSLRLAVDMKAALFRNSQRTWKVNDLHDIDALSEAIPYCQVVVTDKDAADRVRRSGGDTRNGTVVVSTFDQLAELLPALVSKSRNFGGDPLGWDVCGPGEGFATTLPDGSWPWSR